MRIQVRRTGGFAGIEHHREIDTTGRGDAAALHSLAEQTLTEARTEPPVGVPDGFTYQITIDDRTVYCADPRLTEPQRTLISKVLKEGA
ncbi:protealysin inhibitor emfourin [Streptomyces sp. KLOTTS4A1]|uniref:protealysin inhibitor emfourin n=1 Tax=Streptomyces sp. KLOTTS4A1 TaxID=3390996 RepID=UPI0039F636BE